MNTSTVRFQHCTHPSFPFFPPTQTAEMRRRGLTLPEVLHLHADDPALDTTAIRRLYALVDEDADGR